MSRRSYGECNCDIHKPFDCSCNRKVVSKYDWLMGLAFGLGLLYLIYVLCGGTPIGG